MNAFSALLLMSNLPPKAIAVYVVLLQSASPRGSIEESKDSLRQQYKHLTGKRITKRKFKEYREELKERGLVPSDDAVYPMLETKPTNHDDIEDIIDRLERSVEDVRPDPSEFPDHQRICAALIACEALTTAVTRTRKVLKDPETDEAVIDGGEVQKYWKKEWDYGFVEKQLSEHGVEKIVSSVFEIYNQDKWDELRVDDFKERRRRMQGYLIGVLNGEQDVKESTDRPNLEY